MMYHKRIVNVDSMDVLEALNQEISFMPDVPIFFNLHVWDLLLTFDIICSRTLAELSPKMRY